MYANFTDQVNCTIGRSITDRLVMDIIQEGMSRCNFIKDMDPRFLENIRRMTGTANGLEVTDYSVRFIITPAVPTTGCPVVSFIIGFSRHSCKATGVSDIIYRPGVDEKTMDKENATLQIKTAINNFVTLAREIGFIEPMMGKISFEQYPPYPDYSAL